MPKYIVLDDLEHNQEPFAVGDAIELSKKEAQPLLDVKVIRPAGKADEATTEPPVETP